MESPRGAGERGKGGGGLCLTSLLEKYERLGSAYLDYSKNTSGLGWGSIGGGVRLGVAGGRGGGAIPTWGFSCRSRSGIIDSMPADRTTSMRSFPPLVIWYKTHLISQGETMPWGKHETER